MSPSESEPTPTEKGYLYFDTSGGPLPKVDAPIHNDPLTLAEAKVYVAGFKKAKERYALDFAFKGPNPFYWRPDVGGPLVAV